MAYIGIDPGKNGGIAIIRNDSIRVFAMPTDSGELDVQAITKIFLDEKESGEPVCCYLEDVHSIFGMSAGSNFQFGRVLGIIEGVLGATGIVYAKVTPKVWQKEIWSCVTPIANPTGKLLKSGLPHVKIDTKGTSLMAAQKLFPDVNLLATTRSKIPHDGIVDALLIAEYCRRNT